MTLDLEAIAREAGFPDWWINPPEPERKNGAASDLLRNFSALLLEKAAQVCEGMHEEDRPGDYAYAIRSMAAGMGE